VYRADDVWLFTKATMVDPWVYFGIAFNFAWATESFSSTYYWTRFAWTLPGAVFFSLFDPLTAKLLWHLLFFYVAVLSLYVLLRLQTNYTCAVLGVVIMSLDRYLLNSLGWDYMDGAGIAYALLTLCLLTIASTRQQVRAAFVAAGMSFGLLVNVFLPAVVFLPCFLLYAVVLLRREGATRFWLPGLAMGIGLLLSVLFASGVNWYFTGQLDYLRSSREVITVMVSDDPWAPPPLADRLLMWPVSESKRWLHWWIITGGLLGVSAVSSFARRRRPSLPLVATAAYYASALVIWVALEINGQSLSTWHEWSTFLHAGMYVAIAVLLYEQLRSAGRVVSAIALPVLVLGASSVFVWHTQIASEQLVSAMVGLYLALCAGWIAVTVVPQHGGPILRALSVALLVGIILTSLLVRADASTKDYFGQGEASNRSEFLAIVEAVEAVRQVFPHGRPYFIYDIGQPYFEYDTGKPAGFTDRSLAIGNAVNGAFFWGYTMLTNRLPDLDCQQTARVPAVRQIVVMGPSEAVGRTGAQVLERCGLTVHELGSHRIEQDSLSYHLYFYVADGVGETTAADPVVLEYNPAVSATAGEVVEVAVTVAAGLADGDVAWLQVAVNRATDGGYQGEWVILGTQSVVTSEARATFLWHTRDMRPGAHRVGVNIGRTDGETLWWYQQPDRQYILR
jgi:hypothetical protein